MNSLAVFMGLIYGVGTTAACYVVAMITSGLFNRSFYRIYARVLIGICSLMLLVPVLRGITSAQPLLGVLSLTIAQYAVMGVLIYGIARFNRDYMKNVFLERHTTAYFTFGTLANAALVTLAFLHIAVAGAATMSGNVSAYLGPGHFGPFVVLLAALVFHTDYWLKKFSNDARQFSQFTFVGYAVSFFGLMLSTVPYFGSALVELGLPVAETLLLENVSCVQTLFVAICLYVWLIWRYETVPPLFLLLLAIIAEYHMLITQWAIRWWGPASWGLVSLPLFAGIAALNHYFDHWDQRRRNGGEAANGETVGSPILRFAVIFQVVTWGLLVALLGLAVWTRFVPVRNASPIWLGATFGVYAIYFFALALIRRTATKFYIGALLAALATLLGTTPPAGQGAVVALSTLSLAWGISASMGQRIGLKLEYRTALTDCCFLSAIAALTIVLARHFFGTAPYDFHAVALPDGISLTLTMLAFAICGIQYRSRVPVYGGLLALATMAPMMCAGSGLLAMIASELIRRRVPPENRLTLDSRVLLFGGFALPREDWLPDLYARPLSTGAIPLSLIGLCIAAVKVISGDFSGQALGGALISAVVLGLLTKSHRLPWLYVLSLATGYFAIHASSQALVFYELPEGHLLPAHLLLAAAISLTGWLVATFHSAWCQALLLRVAEEREPAIRNQHSFYSGLLYHVTMIAGFLTLLATVATLLSPAIATTRSALVCLSLLTLLFGLSATVYRSRICSYLSLFSIALSAFVVSQIAELSADGAMAMYAGLSTCTAAIACYFWPAAAPANDAEKGTLSLLPWPRQILPIPASGWALWLWPLTHFALVGSLATVTGALVLDAAQSILDGVSQLALLTIALGSATVLLYTRACRDAPLYLVGIGLGYLAIHELAQVFWLATSPVHEALAFHMLIGAVMCLTSWSAAAAMANPWSRASDEQTAETDDAIDFYAGLLGHFSFAACTVYLLALAITHFNSVAVLATGATRMGTGIVLATLLALCSATYRSYVTSYLTLTAIWLATSGAVLWLLDPSSRMACEGMVIASFGLAMGLFSWRLRPNLQDDGDTGWQRTSRIHRIPILTWPPDLLASLWKQPLAQFSVAFAAMGIVCACASWGQAEVWWTLSPFYFAAATWLTASVTWQRNLQRSTVDDARADSSPATVDQSVLFLLAILTFWFAVHATAQLVFLTEIPGVRAFAWHLVITATMACGGWVLAWLFSSRPQTAVDANGQASVPKAILIRAQMLLRVTALLATIDLMTVAATLAALPPTTYVPLVCAALLLAVYFSLAAATTRSILFSYLSLIAVGLAAARLVAVTAERWPAIDPLDACAFSFLGLSLAISSVIVHWLTDNRTDSTASRRTTLDAGLPWRASGWRELWARPFTDAAVCYAGLSLVFAGHHSWMAFPIDPPGTTVLWTLYGCVVTFSLAAWRYRQSAFTYLAAIVLAISIQPLLAIAGEPFAHAGIALSLLALALWAVGFASEKAVGLPSGPRAGNGYALSVTRIYERPLTRCAAVLAIIAIAHSLLVWRLLGWDASQLPLVVVCAIGSATLMCCARSLKVLHRMTRARLLVYLSCAAAAGCSLAITSLRWGFPALGLTTASSALLLAIIGLSLMEWARSMAAARPHAAASRLLYGEPMSHFALGLAGLAVMLALIACFGTLGWTTFPPSTWDDLIQLELAPTSTTLLIAGMVYLLSVRSLRDSRWLYPAAVLGSFGSLAFIESQLFLSPAAFVVVALAGLHLLVGMARIIRARQGTVATILGIPARQCERPFCEWAVVAACGLLLGQGIWLADTVRRFANPHWPWLLTAGLSCGLFYHLLYFRRQALLVHLLIASVMVGCLGVGLCDDWGVTVDVALSGLAILWGLVSASISRPIGKRSLRFLRLPLTASQRQRGARITTGWTTGLMVLALLVTIPVWLFMNPDYPNTSVTMLLVTMGGLIIGYSERETLPIVLAALLFPLGFAVAIVFYSGPYVLLEYSALLTALLAILYECLSWTLRHRQPRSDNDRFMITVGSSLERVAQSIGGAAFLLALITAWWLWESPGVPVAIAMGLMGTLWLWVAWDTKREAIVYLSVIAFGGAAMYMCDQIWGVPWNHPSKGFALVGVSYLLLGLNVLSSGATEKWQTGMFVKPTYLLSLALPTCLMFVIPYDQKSIATMMLLAASSFYMVVARSSHERWATYVAAILVNVALYIWIPSAQQVTGLFQVYVIPAAITVLILAQLHRNDLNQKALNGIRFAASATILAVSTFEVFLREQQNLLSFVVVLVLSLLGTAVGVALRVRLYVFVGLAFLVINVVGQLGLQFQRDSGVLRAVILIGVGLAILAVMIFFNVHRQKILERYRGFMVDAVGIIATVHGRT